MRNPSTRAAQASPAKYEKTLEGSGGSGRSGTVLHINGSKNARDGVICKNPPNPPNPEDETPVSFDAKPGGRRLTEEEASPDGPVEEILDDPPGWLASQLDRGRKDPDRFINPICSAVAQDVYGTATRWQEVKPLIERRLEKTDAKRQVRTQTETQPDGTKAMVFE